MPHSRFWHWVGLGLCLGYSSLTATAVLTLSNTNKPTRVMRLIFIHHSTGEAWLADDHGELGKALRDNDYFVSDTNYGWGPESIGDQTDIGHWWLWFRGPHCNSILTALYAESEPHCGYSRLETPPAGPNQIVMFKSCFPNSALGGDPNDPAPSIAQNPLREQDAGSEAHTVANAKGIYIDLLSYFATMPEKLFVVITAPPLSDDSSADRARAFNQWLVQDWLQNYPGRNVWVWDYYNVLTSNAGSPERSDVGLETGHHHRWWQGTVQHLSAGDNNVSAYASSPGDDHPNAVGDQKATAEFVPLLNAAVNTWMAVSMTPPKLAAVRLNDGKLELTLQQLSPGTAYSVERCADLRAGDWTECASIQGQTDATTWSEPFHSEWKTTFYRIKAQ